MLLVIANPAVKHFNRRALVAARFIVDAKPERHSLSVYGLPLSLAETFDFFALRFHFRAAAELRFDANRLRGAIGKNLKRQSEVAYQRWFAPSSLDGPSGLRDRPRPFVLRASHLEGVALPAAARFCVGLNIFDADAVDDLCQAASQFAPLEDIEREKAVLPLVSPEAARIRVRFITPTELKGADTPEFPALWARVRDRISTLRALYGSGPLPIDFTRTAERAARVRTTRCELQNVSADRLSRSSGRRHPLGGFTGFAEYEGELGEFMPYLEIARHTGVGRQTVWGKGEIHVETF